MYFLIQPPILPLVLISVIPEDTGVPHDRKLEYPAIKSVTTNRCCKTIDQYGITEGLDFKGVFPEKEAFTVQ